MRAELDKPLRIALQDAGEHLDRVPEAFVALFNRGDLSVELFAPHEVDTQQPHEQDEIYIIAAGAGVFRRGADRVPFGPGDFSTGTRVPRMWVLLRLPPFKGATPADVH
jgi:hypothetical protein